MYTTHDNLEHTIKLQEELFRQRLRLRGIALDNENDRHNSSSSEHLYDNIDDETSDTEKAILTKRTRNTPVHGKVSSNNIILSTDDDEQQSNRQKLKSNKSHRVRFVEQTQPMSKRRHLKQTSRTNLSKSTSQKRSNSNQINVNSKKFPLPISSNMLTVTIT